MKRKAHYPVTQHRLKIYYDNWFPANLYQKCIPRTDCRKDSNSNCQERCIHWICQYKSNPLSIVRYDKTCALCNRSSAPFRANHYGLLFTLCSYHRLRYIIFEYGTRHRDRAHTVTLEMSTKCFYLSGFDLTPDWEADEEHISLPCQGNVRIEARFIKPLSEQVKCILCAEFPGHVETDKSRNVK
jgi:hypothetical protein